VKIKKGILRSHLGFSLVSTLVAVAIGGIVATLIASVISDAVRGQRSVVDRDEMSEFALFMKGLVTSDTTCTATLRGSDFTPGGSEKLSVNTGYADVSGPIQDGFKFAGGAISVKSLTMEDTGLAPVQIDIPGGGSTVSVKRYISRIRLQLGHVNGTFYRARIFEVPVLVDSTNKVVACNSQLSLSDACQALGFVWDTTTTPPSCKPAGACMTAGTFTTGAGGLLSGAACVSKNPVTDDCSCPADYTTVAAGAINIQRNCKKGCDSFRYNVVYQCYRCN
jgi:hypothetical protein